MAFVDQNPDTVLLILGSDHACGNGALYGAGATYRASSKGIDLLANQKGSLELMQARLGATPTTEQVTESYRTLKGMAITPAQAQIVVDAITKKVYLPDSVRYSIQPSNTLAWVMNQTDAANPDRPNIGFHSGQHTAQPTMIAVYGKSLGMARIGLVDNTYTYTLMARLLGVRLKNPVMSEQEALAILAPKVTTAMNHPSDIIAL